MTSALHPLEEKERERGWGGIVVGELEAILKLLLRIEF